VFSKGYFDVEDILNKKFALPYFEIDDVSKDHTIT